MPHKTSPREDEMAAWRRQEEEAEALVAQYNADPNTPGVMSHGWAWKGYGFTLTLPLPSHAVTPTREELLATEKESE